MNSLRARLTLSYAIVVGIVLGLLSLLACRIAFDFVARPTLDTLARSVARAENVAAAAPAVGNAEIVARALRAAAAPGIVAFGPFGPPPGGGRPRDGRRPPPGNAPLPDGGGPFGGRDSETAWTAFRYATGHFLGLDIHIVRVRGSRIAVAPNFNLLDTLFQQFTATLLAALLLSIILAWAIAAWLANQAIAPLVALTRELERFSAGDFAPRLVTTSEASELGALIAAYNGAAAQVTLAFNERLDVERHMRRFIADAGHELRTPLTVIGGYLEILRKGGIDDAPTRERALATLTSEARRMRTLIDRLLALARLERPDVSQVTLVDAGDVVAGAIEHVRAARGGDISLVTAARAAVFADPAELSEAIENVIDNAVKYGRGSAVVVQVEVAADEAVIRVSDGGGGIPASEQGRLFERFFRGDDRGDIEGTGLGLAIADRAIARCGGRIELADGTPGRTTFAITIPTAPTRADAAEPLRL